MDDRTGKEMGEKGYKKTVVEKTIFLGMSPCRIDEEGYLGKRKEAYAERQDDPEQGNMQSCHAVQGQDEEIHILEIREKGEIPPNTKEKNRTLSFCRNKSASDSIVKENASQHDRNIDGIPVPIKKERRKNEPGLGGNRQLPPVEKEIDKERSG